MISEKAPTSNNIEKSRMATSLNQLSNFSLNSLIKPSYFCWDTALTLSFCYAALTILCDIGCIVEMIEKE